MSALIVCRWTLASYATSGHGYEETISAQNQTVIISIGQNQSDDENDKGDSNDCHVFCTHWRENSGEAGQTQAAVGRLP